MINFYEGMWRKRSERLAPLARLTFKGVKFKWTTVEQNAFDEIKRVMSTETLLSYPQFDKPFIVHTDASDTQLGAVILQEKTLHFIAEILMIYRKDTPQQSKSCYLL